VDSASSAAALGPGWDRQDRWTLRFLDPALEGGYRQAMTPSTHQRLRAFLALGAAVWLIAAVLGPIFLGVSAAWWWLAAAAATAEAAVAAVVGGRVEIGRQWLVAGFSGSFSAVVVIALSFEPGSPVFSSGVTAIAIMACCIYPIGLVRIAATVAAATAAFQVALFSGRVAVAGWPGPAVLQVYVLVGTIGVAVLAARYLEGAERHAFAQSELVAALHRRIDHLFRQYLSPDVAQALVDDPHRADLGGEVVEVSVLFADLSGYTPFSERTPPADVVAALNESFGQAVPAIFAEGGTIVQFIGDAVMAIFNAPLRQPDHAVRACRAALALQRATKPLAAATARPMFRVAVNTGPALVGNIGSPELRNFSALGDTTNVAARLQTFAPEGAIVVGQRTYQLIREVADVLPLGTAALKGKSTPTPVFQLLDITTGEHKRVSASAAS
jgi:class 3 adenylate cyclase